MRFPGIGFCIGLTMTLFALWFIYDLFSTAKTVSEIFGGIIVFVPTVAIRLFLLSRTIAQSKAEVDNASLFLFGSIWCGVLCFGFAALMLYEVSFIKMGTNYRYMSDRYSIKLAIYLGLALTCIPILTVLVLLKLNAPPKDLGLPPKPKTPKAPVTDNDPLGIRHKLGKKL